MDVNDYRYIAHRGLFNNEEGIPENSLAAFKEAIKEGYAIELDVSLTKDKYVVVYHDLNLKRLTGLDKEINKCNLSEIRKLNLLNTKYKIPILDEVLELVDGKVPLLIEIKNEKVSCILERLLMKKLEKYNGKYIIESFNPFSIYWIKKHYENVAVGQLFVGKGHFVRESFTKVLNLFIKPQFIAYNIKNITKKERKYCNNKKIYLFSWTIRDKEELKKAKEISDGIIFETTKEKELL